MKKYIDDCECIECRDARIEEMKLKQAKINKEKQMINSEMTRSEAVQKLADIWRDQGFTMGDTKSADNFIKNLELLGIVKFKDEFKINTILLKKIKSLLIIVTTAILVLRSGRKA